MAFRFIKIFLIVIFFGNFTILANAKDAKESQLRTGGLIFAIIGFFIIWYMKKNGI